MANKLVVESTSVNKVNNDDNRKDIHVCSTDCQPNVIDVADYAAMEQGAVICCKQNIDQDSKLRLECATALLGLFVFIILTIGAILLLQWVLKMTVVLFITPDHYFIELRRGNTISPDWLYSSFIVVYSLFKVNCWFINGHNSSNHNSQISIQLSTQIE